MTQGETLEELEENIIDAYRLVVFDDVPAKHETKEIVLIVRSDGIRTLNFDKQMNVSCLCA